MHRKTLYIHAGGPKTGSSALQLFLKTNRDHLRKLGCAYIVKTSGAKDEPDISSGNGTNLVHAFHTNQLEPSQDIASLRKLLREFLSEECAAGICSSEQLTFLKKEHWSKVLSAAAAEGIDVSIIYYVRHVAPFFASAYDQGLKRHGFHMVWRDFLGRVEAWEHFEALRRLDEACPPERLFVISYDKHRTALVRSFLQVIGLHESLDSSLIDDGNQRKVNRSLANAERDILLRLNELTADEYSSLFSDALLRTHPNVPPDPPACADSDLDDLGRR